MGASCCRNNKDVVVVGPGAYAVRDSPSQWRTEYAYVNTTSIVKGPLKADASDCDSDSIEINCELRTIPVENDIRNGKQRNSVRDAKSDVMSRGVVNPAFVASVDDLDLDEDGQNKRYISTKEIQLNPKETHVEIANGDNKGASEQSSGYVPVGIHDGHGITGVSDIHISLENQGIKQVVGDSRDTDDTSVVLSHASIFSTDKPYISSGSEESLNSLGDNHVSIVTVDINNVKQTAVIDDAVEDNHPDEDLPECRSHVHDIPDVRHEKDPPQPTDKIGSFDKNDHDHIQGIALVDSENKNKNHKSDLTNNMYSEQDDEICTTYTSSPSGSQSVDSHNGKDGLRQSSLVHATLPATVAQTDSADYPNKGSLEVTPSVEELQDRIDELETRLAELLVSMGADENRAGHVGEVSAFVEEINALNFSLYKKEHFNEAKIASNNGDIAMVNGAHSDVSPRVSDGKRDDSENEEKSAHYIKHKSPENEDLNLSNEELARRLIHHEPKSADSIKNILANHRDEQNKLRMKLDLERHRRQQNIRDKLSERQSRDTQHVDGADANGINDANNTDATCAGERVTEQVTDGACDSEDSSSTSSDDDDSSSSDSDSDTELRNHYSSQLDRRASDDQASLCEDESLDGYSDSSDAGRDSSDEEAEETEAAMTLRTTLTEDIKQNLTGMTEFNFQQLLETFRRKQAQLTENVEKPNSSQGKHMAKTINQNDNQNKSDRGISPVDEEAIESSHSNHIDVQTDRVRGVDVATFVDENVSILHKHQEEIQNLDEQFVEAVRESGRLSPDVFSDMLRKHMDDVDKIRRMRDAERIDQQRRLQERLKHRTQTTGDDDKEINDSDSFAADVHDSSQYDPSLDDLQYRDNDGTVALPTIPVTCDQNLMEELDNLKRKYEKLILRNKDNIKSVQLAGFLEKYRAEQQRLIELKTREKLKSDQKLREKLAQRLRNKKNVADTDENEMKASEVNNHRVGIAIDEGVTEKADVNNWTGVDEDIKRIDGDFYVELTMRQSRGHLSAAELDSLIREHLRKVDMFRRLRQQGENSANLKANREASRLVKDKEESRLRAKKIRDREKARLDEKLQEKLAKRKRNNMNGD